MCKGEGYAVVPQDVVDYDLQGSGGALREGGCNVLRSGILLVAERDGLKHTIHRNGRMLFEPAIEGEEARRTAAELFSLIRPH